MTHLPSFSGMSYMGHFRGSRLKLGGKINISSVLRRERKVVRRGLVERRKKGQRGGCTVGINQSQPQCCIQSLISAFIHSFLEQR